MTVALRPITQLEFVQSSASDLLFVAGGCSITELNYDDAALLAEIASNYGVNLALRVVTLKSRTNPGDNPLDMGLDTHAYNEAINYYLNNSAVDLSIEWPGIELMRCICTELQVPVWTEMVAPWIQLPYYANRLGDLNADLTIWNPAVLQSGHALDYMGMYAAKYGWGVAIKNGKHRGSTGASTWSGLSNWADHGARITLVHRGFDIDDKGDYRNWPDHELASEVRLQTNLPMIYDISHTNGPKRRDHIVEDGVNAMFMQLNGEYVYSGLMVEVASTGKVTTDVGQHITPKEFEVLIERVLNIRV